MKSVEGLIVHKFYDPEKALNVWNQKQHIEALKSVHQSVSNHKYRAHRGPFTVRVRCFNQLYHIDDQTVTF